MVRIRTAEYDKEQERRVNEMNMRFFSNISHEFRTPLTLINGALSMIKDDRYERLHRIMRVNAGRMLRLVEQLMDFNKIENGVLRLSVMRTDVCALMRSVCAMFEASVTRRGIRYSLLLPEGEVVAMTDADKLEKIMVNLVSNAIKYAGEGASLTVRLRVEEASGGKWMRVDVEDTGIGIPEDKREAVFERFYQLRGRGQLPSIGTGVGLYYTKCLVELHHGHIECKGVEPHGTLFTFALPMDEACYTEEERAEVESSKSKVESCDSVRAKRSSLIFAEREQLLKSCDSVRAEASLLDNAEREQLGRSQSSGGNIVQGKPAVTMQDGGGTVEAAADADAGGGDAQRPVVMVIDDDADVLDFLKLLLSPLYDTRPFSKPAAAYTEIEAVKPDLIISDVIMYEIDGYELCSKIKDNSSICHIPVVLLTAKSALSEQIHGLDCGASAYVTKPFSPDYLLSVLKSQLDNVRYIQQSLSGGTKLRKTEEKQLQAADRKLMQTLYAYVEEHLSDVDIDVDELTVSMCMSRSKLFYKIKSLTGETPNAFFKSYKLNRAAEMILQGDDKIAYIADITGFSSASYFATMFRKRFGCSPSEYKQLHGG